jgi:hypothetical protein
LAVRDPGRQPAGVVLLRGEFETDRPSAACAG